VSVRRGDQLRRRRALRRLALLMLLAGLAVYVAAHTTASGQACLPLVGCP